MPNVRSVAIMLLLMSVTPICSAIVLCAQLNPQSPQYRTLLDLIAKEAGLERRLSAVDEQVVTSFCANRPDQIDDLIDARRISAREALAVKKTLVPTTKPADRAPAVTTDVQAAAVKPASSKPTPNEAAAMDSVVDNLFRRWGATWWTDRYVPNSAHAAEQLHFENRDMVRGDFGFLRGGRQFTIPFAAELYRERNSYSVANLCYNDTTSGMTDCTATGSSSVASRLMGAVILTGMVAALNSSDESDEHHQIFCHSEFHNAEEGTIWATEQNPVTGHWGQSEEVCD